VTRAVLRQCIRPRQPNRARLIAHILGGLADIPAIREIGLTDLDRRVGVISFVVDGADDEAVCRILDRHCVATRSGHHCAQPLLRLLGLTGTVRASLAPYSDDSDVEALLHAVDDAGRKLR
jgi:cysteine desulfurase/selenocysteine lyase